MTAKDVKALPISEKLQLMEAIWEDLRERFEGLELTPELKHLLDERRRRVEDGSAKIHDWDSVKASIGRP